jgi:F-type H+-transporting ATPase subunit epsilon
VKLEVLTPDQQLFKGNVRSITVPGKKGSFMVLKNHAPIVSTLTKGTVSITTHEYKEENIIIKGGVIEVKNNTIVVLADIK